MNPIPSLPRVVRFFRWSSWLLSIASLYIALKALAGWTFDIFGWVHFGTTFETFNQLGLAVAMNPMTALGIILASVSLLLRQNEDSSNAVLARFLASIPIAFGVIRLLQHTGLPGTPIDQWLFTAKLNGNRMAPNTAICGILAGMALIWIDKSAPRFHRSQILALLLLTISMLTFTGHLFGVESLTRVSSRSIPMALNTAVAYLCLSLGILFARPETGLMRALSCDGPSGVLARRVLPFGFLAPLILGYIRLMGERAGVYSMEFSAASFALSALFLSCVLIWGAAVAIYELDDERRTSESGTRVQYRITQILSDALSFEEASAQILEVLCRGLGWKVGGFWMPDEADQMLRHVAGWLGPSARFAAFVAQSHAQTFIRGVGLPGRVWLQNEAVWVTDVVIDNNFPRAAHALAAGLHTAAAFPIEVGEKAVGIMEFFDQTTQPFDSKMLSLLRNIGQQIGQFVERKHAQAVADKAREAMIETARLKSEFMTNMSHEIRTPLNAIIGMTELMLQSPLSPDQKEHAEIIRTAVESLLGIVNNLLDFSKMEAGKMQMETVNFDLRALMAGVVQMLQHQARAKGIELRFSSASDLISLVRGDPTRIRQVLTNLVGNAIKFTEKGRVTVSASAAENERGLVQVRFTVEDTGIGIPLKAQERLFESFVQADASTTRRFGGTGLGLALSRRLVQLMGGHMEFTSQPGIGSTFAFTVLLEKQLPAIARPSTAGGRPKAVLSSEGQAEYGALKRGLRVLLAEDMPANQKVAGMQLERLGCIVDFAMNGRQAIESAARVTYDLILMDCQMPEMNGFDASQELRRRGVRAPIVAMTANALEGDREKCLEAGMNDYLSKPVKLAQLGAVLERWTRCPAGRPDAVPVDLAVIREVTDGDEANFKKLIASFRKDIQQLMPRLETAVRQRAASEIRAIAHAMAGTSASYGAQELAVLLRDLERMGRDQTLVSTAACLESVQKEYGRVVQFLDGLQSGPTAARSAGRDA